MLYSGRRWETQRRTRAGKLGVTSEEMVYVRRRLGKQQSQTRQSAHIA